MTNHPPLGVVDVFYATLPTLDFKPGVHVNYQETRAADEGRPAEAQGLPERIRRLGRDDGGVASGRRTPTFRGQRWGSADAEKRPSRAGRGDVLSGRPGCAERLDRGRAPPGAARRKRRAEGRRRAARRPRLFRLGRRDRVRPVGAPRRAGSPRRHHRPGAPRRVSRDRNPPRGEMAHPARRGDGRARRSRRSRPGAWRLRRCAAVRRRAFARNASRDASSDAAGPVRNRAHSGRRGRSPVVAEALRRVWGGPETVVAVSSDLSHFLDQRSAEAIDSDTGRRIETLDAAALNGRRACGFLAIKGALEIAAERDMRATGLHLATSADAGADASRVVGYGAFALEYAASARLAEADRERLLSACMAALGRRRGPAARPRRRASTPRRPRFRLGARPSSP